MMASFLNEERCSCDEFMNADPANKAPTDRLKFLHYLRHGPIQPTDIGSAGGRTFQISWYEKFSWLEYSISKKASFCYYCRLFASRTALFGPSQGGPGGRLDESFTKEGFINWKKALEKGRGFHKHCESKGHLEAEKAYRTFLRSKPVDEQLSDEHERQVAASKLAAQRNRSILGRLFGIVRWLGRLSLPFRGHNEGTGSSNKGVYRELVELMAGNGDAVLEDHLDKSPKNAMYLSPDSQNDMINVVGSAIVEEIVKRVKSAKYFSFMMDGTPDSSHQEQYSVFVRYLHIDTDPVIEERFLGIVVAKETTGEALTKLLLELLEKRGLNICDAVGQGHDGGRNMSGDVKGVQARVREINPNCLFVKCYGHDLNRAIVNAVNSSENSIARDFFGVMELLITFIEASAGRFEHFMSLQKDDGNKALKPMKLSDTRWSSRALSLERYNIPYVLKAAIGTVEHVIESTSDNIARGTAVGLKASIKKKKFFVALVALAPVFSAVNQVTESLQSPNLDVMEADSRIACLKKELQDLRSEHQWGKVFKEAKEKIKTILSEDDASSLELESQNRRSRKIPRRIDERPQTQSEFSDESESLRVQFYYPLLDRIISELNARFHQN